MLRTNLATRPFYNERLVHVALGLAALACLLGTVLAAICGIRQTRAKRKSYIADMDREYKEVFGSPTSRIATASQTYIDAPLETSWFHFCACLRRLASAAKRGFASRGRR